MVTLSGAMSYLLECLVGIYCCTLIVGAWGLVVRDNIIQYILMSDILSDMLTEIVFSSLIQSNKLTT